MWYLSEELVKSYHHRKHQQSQIIRICEQLNIERRSVISNMFHLLGEILVSAGLALKQMSKRPARSNGISSLYDYS